MLSVILKISYRPRDVRAAKCQSETTKNTQGEAAMNTSTRGFRIVCGIAVTGILVLFSAALTPAQDEGVAQAVKAAVAGAKEQVESISVDELAAVLAEGQPVRVLDVRTEAAFEAGHIKGATWVPRGKLEFVALKGKLGPTSDRYVTYCRMDSRSALSAATLKGLGYTDVKYLKGGFKPWVTSGQSIYNVHGELTVKEFEKGEE